MSSVVPGRHILGGSLRDGQRPCRLTLLRLAGRQRPSRLTLLRLAGRQRPWRLTLLRLAGSILSEPNCPGVPALFDIACYFVVVLHLLCV